MVRSLFFFSALTLFLFAGCSTYKSISSEGTAEPDPPPDYRVIYYIHGDSDYLFHDRGGIPKQADDVALSRALQTAEEANSGEVFIFHHKNQRKWAGLFPRRSNRFYHFKNGELINEIKYRPENNDESFLATESKLFDSINTHSDLDRVRNVFLFFGHEIPSEPATKYHSSFPEISVDRSSFTEGIKHFIPEETKYDVTVLSSCSNGSPEMAKELLPVTEVLLASPQNLHLSHMHPKKLSMFETNPDAPAADIAEAMAEETYRELSSAVQTVITLTVYRMDELQPYIKNLNTLVTEYAETHQINPFRENRDCADLGVLDGGEFNSGIKTFYRAPAFGRESNKENHSGWGCKPTD